MLLRDMLYAVEVDLGAALVSIEDGVYGGYTDSLVGASAHLHDACGRYDEIAALHPEILADPAYRQADDLALEVMLIARKAVREALDVADKVAAMNDLHEQIGSAISRIKDYRNAQS